MRLQVRELGDEVHIEVSGLAGRHQRVLEALTECQGSASCATGEQHHLDPKDVSVRAGANDMRIRLKGKGEARIEAASIYRCLRHALFEHVEAVVADVAVVG